MTQENTKLCDFSNTNNNDFISTMILLDLILASDHGGIDNPFIALGVSVWLFVLVDR